MLIDANRVNLFHTLEASGIPEDARSKLASLGITTLSELKDHWDYGNRDLIVTFLGRSPIRMSAAPELAARRGPVAAGGLVNLSLAGRTRPLVKHARGVLLSASEQAARAVSPDPLPALASAHRGVAAASPPNVSLVSKFPAIRNQKDRGTCVAFATVGFLEFHRMNSGGSARRFSEQFVYWGCKKDDGIPSSEGTFVSTARSVISNRGACLGSTWKYNPIPVPGNEGQGPPPAGAENEATNFLYTTAKAVAAKNPMKIRDRLDAGQPVVLSVKTFSSWDFPTVGDTGEVPMPLPGSVSDGGHAICVVGYELNPRFPGGGAFIIRNSWGKTWGKLSRFAPGYGTLFFDYVKKYSLEAYV